MKIKTLILMVLISGLVLALVATHGFAQTTA